MDCDYSVEENRRLFSLVLSTQGREFADGITGFSLILRDLLPALTRSFEFKSLESIFVLSRSSTLEGWQTLTLESALAVLAIFLGTTTNQLLELSNQLTASLRVRANEITRIRIVPGLTITGL